MTKHPEAPIRVERTSYSPGFHSDWHANAEAQLIYPSLGVMRIHQARAMWTVPPLRGFWLPANEPHKVETPGRLEMHSVYCRAGLAAKLPGRSGIVTVPPLLREVIFAMERGAGTLPGTVSDTVLMQLFADMMAIQPAAQLAAPRLTSARLQRIEAALRKEPANRLTLNDWADKLGCSARTLAREFQADTGLGFREYRTQMRLHAAIEMLAAGQSATSVAYDLGFASPSAFAAMFRRATGTSPGRYFAD